MQIQRCLSRALAFGVLAFGVAHVSGQSYPVKPIRIVTGLPGGGSDVVTRLIANGSPRRSGSR